MRKSNCSRREFFCITWSAGAAAPIRGTGSPVAAIQKALGIYDLNQFTPTI